MIRKSKQSTEERWIPGKSGRSSEVQTEKYWKTRWLIGAVLLFLLFFVVLILGIFFSITSKYRSNINEDNAGHLVEIGSQVRLYVENGIAEDWERVDSIANSVKFYSDFDREQIVDWLLKECEIMGASDIVLYTEDGGNISASGKIRANDTASDLIVKTKENGSYMSIIRSSLTYSVPVSDRIFLNQSKIAAVSIERDLSSFLDDMKFSSFGGAAYLYLTQENGVIVSSLTHPDGKVAYNIMSLLGDEELICMSNSNHSVSEILVSEESHTYLQTEEGGKRYIVSLPVQTKCANLRLFYMVPMNAVVKTMDDFYAYVTGICALLMILTVAALNFAFAVMYRQRKKRFDHSLLSRERMFSILTQNSQNAYELLNIREAVPLYYTKNIERMTGLSYVGLKKSENGFELILPDTMNNPGLEAIRTPLSNWNGKGAFTSDYISFDVKEGTGYFSLSFFPVDDSTDEFICIVQNRTHEYEREEVIKNALDMADKANASKTRFLANMSHDIRTPMNAIINISNFAAEHVGDDKELAEYIGMIQDSSEHLLGLINDILDMSRIESGQAVIAMERFSLIQLVRSTEEMIKPLCDKKNQMLQVDYSEVKSEYLIGDKLKLSQIFINLMNNAVKFTPENGKIRFTASEQLDLRVETAAFVFTVSDNGMGISPERIPHIFEAFMRGDSKRVGEIEGSGLGLSICKSYVSAMGGTISCDSKMGEGTTFAICLSLARANEAAELIFDQEQKTQSSCDAGIFAGKRALLCEDNQINRMIACKVLQNLGFVVETATNGEEGWHQFDQSQPGYFDVIYMDVQMPIMDGYEATRAIRNSEHPQARHIPIIAMTANVFTEDVERSRNAGMNSHISKPLVVSDLIAATGKFILIHK